jgi:hypothetical protein
VSFFSRPLLLSLHSLPTLGSASCELSTLRFCRFSRFREKLSRFVHWSLPLGELALLSTLSLLCFTRFPRSPRPTMANGSRNKNRAKQRGAPPKPVPPPSASSAMEAGSSVLASILLQRANKASRTGPKPSDNPPASSVGDSAKEKSSVEAGSFLPSLLSLTS